GQEFGRGRGPVVPVVVDQADLLAHRHLTIQHLPDVADPRSVGATHRVLLGETAGGDDHHVRIFRLHHLRGNLGPQFHLDPGLVHLVFFIPDDDAELVAAGPLHGGYHLPPQGLPLIEEGDIVSPAAGHLGGPHAGRTAADDHHLLLYRRL